MNIGNKCTQFPQVKYHVTSLYLNNNNYIYTKELKPTVVDRYDNGSQFSMDYTKTCDIIGNTNINVNINNCYLQKYIPICSTQMYTHVMVV